MLRCLNNRIAVLFVALTAIGGSLYACGYVMPNRVLSESYALKVPKGYFEREVARIEPPFEPGFQAIIAHYKNRYDNVRDYGKQTQAGDLADLAEALAKSGLSEGQRRSILAAYDSMREVITSYVREKTRLQWQRETDWRRRGDDAWTGPLFNPPSVPDGLPGEFDDYIRGAIDYHRGYPTKAVQTWRRLLDRPADERRYKSTWAAFMIGRALLDTEPGEAVKWFRHVRELAEGGFSDSLALATASLGWEGRAELNIGNPTRAIELYLTQMACGDASAKMSLLIVARKLAGAKPAVLRTIAQNAPARRVLTAYMVSRVQSWPYQSSSWAEVMKKWLDAMEATKVDFVSEGDRLAWAAYYLGDMELTARWLNVANQNSTMTQWLRAKLLLRAGKVDEAAEQLRLAARTFAPATNEEQGGHGSLYNHAGMFMTVDAGARSMRGELGVLYLARRQYVEALDVLLQGGHWAGAAYVAERVLTPRELKAYVDRIWPESESDPNTGGQNGQLQRLDWMRERIRYLLARRLARLGQWDDARAYYPAQWRNRFDIYTQALRDGSNLELTQEKRAQAFWKAAIIARHEGIELLGTEVEPDWFMMKGRFSAKPLSEIRANHETSRFAPSTPDEARRTQQHAAVPNLRWHYRYTATQHAWRAAELLPDNSDETARVLCIGGSWLKMQDPNEADRFYKALVRRCRKTRLGRQADNLRWFPGVEMDRKKLLEETR